MSLSESEAIRQRIAALSSLQNESLSKLQLLGDRMVVLREKLSKQHSEIRHQNTFAASKCGVSLNEAHALDEAAKKVMQDREHVLLTLEKDNHQLNECIMEYEATMALLVQKHKEQMQNAHSELQRERQSMMKLVESEQENSRKLQQSIHQLGDQLSKSHDVMKLASEAHESDLVERDMVISRLQAENEGLRQLLQISDTILVDDEESAICAKS
eukprot:TRINITY_DN4320_c0_g1_i1.p1 TRINITY_DN4320_c0_g1~~TRINITY_DN4320_c0_g1_i1.p1  ORF type:complete len:214 (+),score=59.95 TRINITY_DN4320_c0_g1_i1:43-684(+)